MSRCKRAVRRERSRRGGRGRAGCGVVCLWWVDEPASGCLGLWQTEHTRLLWGVVAAIDVTVLGLMGVDMKARVGWVSVRKVRWVTVRIVDRWWRNSEGIKRSGEAI